MNKADSTFGTSQKYYPNDTATATGSTGNVTFTLYGPYAAGVTPNCLDADKVFTQSVAQSGGSATTSNGAGVGANAPITLAGTYAWVVSLASTATHNGRNSACGAEQFTIAVTNDAGPGTP